MTAAPVDHDAYDDDWMAETLAMTRTIAVVGASANPTRASSFVMKYLLDHGFDAIPVNPGLAGGQVHGRDAHASLSDLPEAVDMIDIFRNSDAAAKVVDEALTLPTPPKVIWMQIGIRHDEAAARAERAGIRVVMNRCTKIEHARLRAR